MKTPTRHLLAAVILGLVLGALAIAASRVVYVRQQALAQESADRSARQAAFQIELAIASRIAAGRHLQQLWRVGDISTDQSMRRHSSALWHTYQDIRFIARLTDTGRVAWVEPAPGHNYLLGRDFSQDPAVGETFENVVRMGQAAPTPPFQFRDGGTGFLGLYPLDDAARRNGFVAIAFHAAPIVERALGQIIPSRYRVEVRSSGRLVHAVGANQFKPDVYAAASFQVLDRDWSVSLWPSPRTLAAQIGNDHVVVLAFGLPIAFILAVLTGMFLSRHVALRVSETIATALVDNVTSSLNIKGLDGRYLRVNRKFCEWAGKSSEQVLGRTEREVHGDREGVSDLIDDHEAEVLALGVPIQRERRAVFSDGQERHVLVAKFPINDDSGRIVALGTAVTDISKQKAAEDILRRSHDELEKLVAERTRELRSEIRVREIAEASWRESEERLRDIAESASDWFWELDQDLRFTYISNRFFEISSLDRRDVVGKTRWEFSSERSGDDEAHFARHRADLEARRPFRNFEYALKNHEDRIFYVRLSGRPVFDNLTGEFAGYRGAGTDVTATREAEQALVRANEELERRVDERTKELRQEVAVRRRAQELADQASRAKTDFLANVSHEFRTPLNGIIGFAEILAGEVFGKLGAPRYKEYSEDIIRSGRHLLALINDVLDVSRIEAGAMALHEEPVNMATAVEECVSMVEQRAEAKEVALTTEVPKGLPMIRADLTRIKQIILNLVTNAVKFTEPGGRVEVSVSWSPQEGHVLKVSDTGIGIEAKDIPKVLMPFGQAHRAFTRAHEGFGLGLSLVHSLTEEHGGSLEIDSTPGKGTTVIVRFPAERTANDAEAAQ